LILLLGITENEYGQFTQKTQARNRSSCTLSVGSDPLSPARIYKARHDVPNEDALLLIDEGPRTLLAIADSHFGHEASHNLLQQFSTLATPIPDNPLAALDYLRESRPFFDSPSETTLLLAILDRSCNQVFGYSFGDSSLVCLDPTDPPRQINEHNSCFLSPSHPDSFDPRLAREFSTSVHPGDLLLAYSDGVDACHYNHPETSITLAHIHRLYQGHPHPAPILEALTELALQGVPPNPGGQDNIATICTRV